MNSHDQGRILKTHLGPANSILLKHQLPVREQAGYTAITMSRIQHLRRIRVCIAIVIVGLLASGVTAFPLQAEVHWLAHLVAGSTHQSTGLLYDLQQWLDRVDTALTANSAQYPFLSYGTDWLAFAHLVIAIAFIGPYIDPVRNKWVITFGLIACAGVIPLALIAGPIRGIPIGWSLIDCSFGVFGAIPLFVCRRSILALEQNRDPANLSR
jgi:hypothetical protein